MFPLTDEPSNPSQNAQKNMRVIHDALRESLAAIDITFGPTLPSFKRDRLQTATGKERSVAQFLESYLPSDWSVKKGPIYDNHGGISAEVDCAICLPQHPPCRTPNRDIILAEGVYVAIEVKPDIRTLTSKGEFARAVDQGVSVKKLQRKVDRFDFLEKATNLAVEVDKLPYVIFAKEVADFEKTITFLDQYKNDAGISAWDLPDIVVGYKGGLIYHAPEIAHSIIKGFIEKLGKSSGEAYLLFDTGTDTLIIFLALLFSFRFPIVQPTGLILKNYILPIQNLHPKLYSVTE